MSWLFFAVLTPALLSISSYIDKFVIDKRIKDPAVITIFGSIVSFFVGLVILLVRGFPLIPPLQLGFLLASGCFLVFYLIPYFKALSLDDASRVVPLYQFVPIFTLILSSIFLGEKMKLWELMGFYFIIIGGIMLGTDGLETGMFKPRKSFYLMILASLLYALTSIFFKFAVSTTDFWLAFGYENIGLGIGALFLLLLPHYRKRFLVQVRQVTKNIWSLLLTNEGFSTGAQLSLSYAFALAPAGLVSVVVGIGPFFTFIYGLILSVWFPTIIKEDISKKTLLIKTVSTILLFVGIYFLNL